VRWHRPTAAALVAASLLAAGCGGVDADGNRYVARVNRAQQDFANQVERLSKNITPTSSPEADRRTLRSFERAVDEVGVDLRRISPPPEVRGLHATLIHAVDGYGVEVRHATAAMSSHSPTRLRRAQHRLAQATTSFGTTINRTIEAINKRLGGS
jgi:hypothetical protein